MGKNLHENIIRNLIKLEDKKELSKKFEILNKFSQEEFEEFLLPLMLYCFNEGVSGVATDFSTFLNSISK